MSFRKEILIVEDNEINREILADILSEDYKVLEAENGQAALGVLKEHKSRISLILLDVQMPVMDGYSFLNQVKADPELSMIPVIVTTQSNSEVDELAALDHGATDFVPKPYRPQIIRHRVSALIKLRETAGIVNRLQYDSLTGLYSREFFYQKVSERLLEDPDGKYCIIGSNIENFKLVNDSLGAREGDRLLREVADTARQIIGNTGFCGRYGADRFLFFRNQSQELWDRMNFENMKLQEASSVFKNVVMRWGIYEITDRTVPVEKMCDRAFLAADRIKNQYDRFFSVYDDSLRDTLLREQAITSAMETALREEQFEIYLQPKYSLNGKCMAGAEALVRWNHPQWGFMSPGEFIPLFENNGFIPKLDLYVWERVCAKLRQWKEEGYPILPISVNVSRADVFKGDLKDKIASLTQKYGIDPAYLHLEITESAYAANPDQIVKAVDDLRKLGFIVEMDDFGSGYSSFNMLSQMSVDILKLDTKFVQNEIAKPADRSFLNDVVSMAHRAGLLVVAEGVETREQMYRLQDVGCDYAQGYFFAKPMPVAQFEELLKKQKKAPSVSGARRGAAHRNRLLVADEDAGYRNTVREIFSASYQVTEAESAEEALVCLHSEEKDSISAVILSTNLAEKGVLSVMNLLRQDPAFWDVPVLATIPSNRCAAKLSLAREADDFLCKDHPLFDLKKRVQKLVDAASFHKRERVLLDEASHDPLTGVLNRRGFQNALSAIHDGDMPVAICIFDLDNLKVINDTYGHDTGDRMLQCFADQLSRQTRSEDVKCRHGGDEFILILKHINDLDVAAKKCMDICRSFRECVEKEGFSATCSVGISLCRQGEKLTQELMKRADQALYRAKRENKGGVSLWQEADADA